MHAKETHVAGVPETLAPLVLALALLALPRLELFGHVTELGEEILLVCGVLCAVDVRLFPVTNLEYIDQR